jgi:hypothetical protein
MMDFKDVYEFREKSGYEIDGVWYPRVTKIVEIKAKPALYRFYAGLKNFNEGEVIKEKSAVHGTMVHEAVQAIILNRNPQVDPEIQPAVSAFQKFFGENPIKSETALIEKRVVSHDHRYAGTVDAIAEIGGKFGVLDIKTSQSIYRDYNLQTAAYMEALKNNFHNLQTRWILKIDQHEICGLCSAKRRTKGGREKIRTNWGATSCKNHEWGALLGDVEIQEFPFWQNDFEAFLGAKKLWEWENEYWLKKIGYLS